jgi:uncharacterized membrane protein
LSYLIVVHRISLLKVNISEQELAGLNPHAAVAYYTINADIVGDMLNKGSLFFTIALRLYYLSFPLLAWFAGPWFAAGATIVLVLVLRTLDFQVPPKLIPCKPSGSQKSVSNSTRTSLNRSAEDTV